MLRHFAERMDDRALVWADVLAILDKPRRVQSAGHDQYGRPRWIIAGRTTDKLRVEIVTVLDQDDAGHWTLLVTLYHED